MKLLPMDSYNIRCQKVWWKMPKHTGRNWQDHPHTIWAVTDQGLKTPYEWALRDFFEWDFNETPAS